MEWIETIDSTRQCKKWLPKSQHDRLTKAQDLGKKTEAAMKSFKGAKRKREKPDKLKVLKATRDAAVKAYRDQSTQIVGKGVYVLETQGAFCVLRNNAGSTVQSRHHTLEEAQAAAEAM